MTETQRKLYLAEYRSDRASIILSAMERHSHPFIKQLGILMRLADAMDWVRLRHMFRDTWSFFVRSLERDGVDLPSAARAGNQEASS